VGGPPGTEQQLLAPRSMHGNMRVTARVETTMGLLLLGIREQMSWRLHGMCVYSCVELG